MIVSLGTNVLVIIIMSIFLIISVKIQIFSMKNYVEWGVAGA